MLRGVSWLVVLGVALLVVVVVLVVALARGGAERRAGVAGLPRLAQPAPPPTDLADRARTLVAAGRHDEAVRLVTGETGMSPPEATAFLRALEP